MRRIHVVITGTVQGVGYRYTLRAQARAAGVAGWARNRLDGTVEAQVEGTDPQVERILAWMAEGPPGARVTVVRTTDVSPTGRPGFHLRPTA